MADDDSLFEKALARQLRQRGPENGESASEEQVEGLYQGCPDAEALAAYHERTLSVAEMIACKEHVVGCGRCQEILALLETTEDVPVSAESADREKPGYERERFPRSLIPMTPRTESLGDAESRPVAIAHLAKRMPVTAPAVSAPLPAPAKRGRWASAYWLAPLGAIAAGLLVWVGTQTHNKDASRQAAVETAENHQVPQPATTQPATRQTFDAPAPKASAPMMDRKDAPTKSADEISAGLPQSHDERKLKALAQGAPKGMAAPRAKIADKAEATPPPDIGAATETVEVTNAAPPVKSGTGTTAGAGVVVNEQAQLQTNGRNASQLSTGMEQQNAQKQAAPPPPAPAFPSSAANTLGQTSDTGTSLMTLQRESGGAKKITPMRASMVKGNSRLIPAPGGMVIWRVGKGGRIEQSRDAGATWSLQTSGVTAELETGSAPSDAVCWVMGASDTILVTVDGGGHWAKITSPLAGEIAGVRAVDALNATVWDAGYKNTFTTSDGGVLWKRVANK